MAYCPADLKPCIDDLCYGGGCLNPLAAGEAMLMRCDGCLQFVAIDGSDSEACECEPDDDRDDEEWEDEE